MENFWEKKKRLEGNEAASQEDISGGRVFLGSENSKCKGSETRVPGIFKIQQGGH